MVTLHQCDSYEEAAIEAAVDQLLRDLGGWEPYITPGESVLLKVNLVAAKGPAMAATTHPALVKALARRLTAYGCSVTIGDSPGGPFTEGALLHAYKITGMEEAALSSGATLALNTGTTEVKLPSGRIVKSLTLTDMSLQADKVISVCKLKTHSWMTYTGAEKNLFGCVPGTMKAEYHVRMPDMDDFSLLLADICEVVHPVLSFMDGVLGMEGNGPTNGSSRKVGCLLASPSPYDLDRTACQLIGLSPEDVPSIRVANSLELGSQDPEVLGDSVADFMVPDYRMPDHIHKDLSGGKGFMAWGIRHIKPKVTFDHAKCIGCGRCHEACPPKALTMIKEEGSRQRPTVDHRKCIHCYCCQELCPQNAVIIKENPILHLMQKL